MSSENLCSNNLFFLIKMKKKFFFHLKKKKKFFLPLTEVHTGVTYLDKRLKKVLTLN